MSQATMTVIFHIFIMIKGKRVEMKDDISKIDQRIAKLKLKKERLKTEQALLLLKETQIILGEDFSFDLVLFILSHSWTTASQKQKEEWKESARSFRRSSQEISPPKSESSKVQSASRKDPRDSAENTQD